MLIVIVTSELVVSLDMNVKDGVNNESVIRGKEVSVVSCTVFREISSGFVVLGDVKSFVDFASVEMTVLCVVRHSDDDLFALPLSLPRNQLGCHMFFTRCQKYFLNFH